MTGKDTRLFAKFAIDFPGSPKIAGLSDAAFRAFVEAVCYSREYRTDGFIPAGVARKQWSAAALAELSSNHPERPSLAEVDGGWRIHDFAAHQMTTADIEAKRRAGAAGGRAKASNRLAGATDALQQSAGENVAPPLQRSESQMTTGSDAESSHYPAAREATDGSDAMTVRLAGQQGISDLSAVISTAARCVDRRLTASGALQLSLHILGKAATPPRNAQPYVLRSIERTPAEVQQFIDEAAIAV